MRQLAINQLLVLLLEVNYLVHPNAFYWALVNGIRLFLALVFWPNDYALYLLCDLYIFQLCRSDIHTSDKNIEPLKTFVTSENQENEIEFLQK